MNQLSVYVYPLPPEPPHFWSQAYSLFKQFQAMHVQLPFIAMQCKRPREFSLGEATSAFSFTSRSEATVLIQNTAFFLELPLVC